MKESFTHYTFVAPEIAPAIAVAMDERLDIAQNILMHTPDMEERARLLAMALQQHGQKSVSVEVSSAFEAQALRPAVEAIFARHGPGYVNISCGTHVMGVVAACVAEKMDYPVVYLRPDDMLVWLDNRKPPLQLQDQMRAEMLLAARGWQIDDEKPDPELVQAARSIRNMLHTHGGSTLAAIRKMAASIAEQEKGRSGQEVEVKLILLHREEKRIGEIMADAGLARWEKGWLKLPKKGRQFLRGGWLEWVVYDAALELQRRDPRLQSVVHAKRAVLRSNTNHQQETDLILVYDNKLHVVECKATLRKDGFEWNKLLGYIYKLDTIMDMLGGRLARGLLLTNNPTVPRTTLEKGQMRQVTIAGEKQLFHLLETLHRWLKNGSNSQAVVV